MKIVTSLDGELASVLGPRCLNPACSCGEHAVSLFSGKPVKEVIVVECDDLTPAELLATCEAFLYCIGWADEDGAVAALMASECVAAAGGCDVGTHLMPHYDTITEQWDWFIVEHGGERGSPARGGPARGGPARGGLILLDIII